MNPVAVGAGRGAQTEDSSICASVRPGVCMVTRNGLPTFREEAMKPVYRNRKPDPLVLLALLVALGVLVTMNLPTALNVAAAVLPSLQP